MRLRQSVVYRKGRAFVLRLPRAARRWFATAGAYHRSPPVLGNSFPKSGTHLLVQILEALPDQRRYGTFIASTPTVPFRERTPAAIRRRLRALAPGELALAHLFHSADARNELQARHAVHFFVYRDLRDVAVSEAHYLTHMNRWHGMHRYFSRTLTTEEARIRASILGVPRAECGHEYPDIGRRWARYAPWLAEADVCAVKFESLRGDPGAAIDRIVRFYADRTPRTDDWDAVAHHALENVAPARSHTFRRGEMGGWRTAFTGAHRDAFKTVAGQVLIELGYEQTLDW